MRPRILPPRLAKLRQLGGSSGRISQDVTGVRFSDRARRGNGRGLPGDRRLPTLGAVDADVMLYPGSRLELVPDDFKDANHLQHLGAHLVRGSWLAGVLQSRQTHRYPSFSKNTSETDMIPNGTGLAGIVAYLGISRMKGGIDGVQRNSPCEKPQPASGWPSSYLSTVILEPPAGGTAFV
jgi:hypothetical protein